MAIKIIGHKLDRLSFRFSRAIHIDAYYSEKFNANYVGGKEQQLLLVILVYKAKVQ